MGGGAVRVARENVEEGSLLGVLNRGAQGAWSGGRDTGPEAQVA